MDGFVDSSALLLGTAVAGLALIIVLFCMRPDEDDKRKDVKEERDDTRTETEAGGRKESLPKKNPITFMKKKIVKKRKSVAAGHPLLATELKGHTATVTSVSFDPSGDYVASSSADRTIRVWYSKEFTEKEHKCHRINVDLDHALSIRFSPDSRALVAGLDDACAVRVFKLNRKKDGSIQGHSVALDMPKQHAAELVNVAIASTGKYILTASTDTRMMLWDLKGDVLATLETKQVTTHWADISPSGRFIATCGFTSDVMLFEVKYSKSGEFEQVSRAMDLKGHTAATYHFSFSQDSRKVATVSKDGTWKLWSIDVRFDLKQDPELLQTVAFDHSGPSLVALAPDALSLAVASGTNIFIFNAESGICEEQLIDVHTSDISSLSWSPSSSHLCSAGGDDKPIRVWNNSVGIRASILALKQRLKSTSSAMVKDRIQSEVERLKILLRRMS